MRPSFAIAVFTLLPCAGYTEPASQDRLRQLDSIGRSAVERPCARPTQVTIRMVPNRFDPNSKDEEKRVVCPGLEAYTYVSRASSPPRLLPLALKATAPVAFIPRDLQIGSPEENLKPLGKPASADGGKLSYVLPSEPGRDAITFTIHKGKVSTIQWSWDVD